MSRKQYQRVSQNVLGPNLDALDLADKVYDPGLWTVPDEFELDQVATQPSVYDDPDKKDRYWPRSDYENLHRFDPEARWTWREEFALVRKIDVRIMIWTCVMFFALEIDRSNLSQANSDDFLTDLGLSTDDFNNGHTIFRTAFLLAELPSQLISKRLGPDRWVPTQMVLWSVVAMFQFYLTGRTSFYVSRAILGMLQGGFIPDVILYLSYFYTGRELPLRCSYFWMAGSVAGIVSSFMSYGILHLRGYLGRAGWRWLFLLEGLFTLVIGLLSYGLMPASPTETKGWLRGKAGWFTDREETIITTRVLRDDPTKGDMHNRQGITPKLLWKCMADYNLWPIYVIGILFGIPGAPPNTYLTLTLRDLGFNTFQTNLLVIPASVLGMASMWMLAHVSELVDSRALVAMLSQFWVLPGLVALNMFGADTNPWVKYVVTLAVVSHPSAHAIQVAWCSRNSNAVGTRTVSASLYNISVQLSGIISSQIYRADDAPLYKRGNKVLLVVNLVNIAVYLGTHLYYSAVNARRDRLWSNMSEDERNQYIHTTPDEASKRLDFRFAW